MPCTQINIPGTDIGIIKTLKFTKDHESKIGIVTIEVSGSEWVPIKFYWADGLTEVISIEPNIEDNIGHEIAYGVDHVCVEIEGHPNTKICTKSDQYEVYALIAAAALIAILLFRR